MVSGPTDEDLDRRIAEALRAQPDDDALLRVVDGTASQEERRAVERSASARARLELLRAGLAEAEKAPPGLAGTGRYLFRVGRDLLELLRGATTPLAPPQAAWATRGPSTPEPVCELRHDLGALAALVHLEQVTRDDGQPTLDLQVRLVDPSNRPVSRGRVTLRRRGRTIDSMPVDAGGAALFTALEADRYDLEVRADGEVAGVLALEFLA